MARAAAIAATEAANTSSPSPVRGFGQQPTPAFTRLQDLMEHPSVKQTNGVFGFPFHNMPKGGNPQDWEAWAETVQQWAESLKPQVQAWAYHQAPNMDNPLVWPHR